MHHLSRAKKQHATDFTKENILINDVSQRIKQYTNYGILSSKLRSIESKTVFFWGKSGFCMRVSRQGNSGSSTLLDNTSR
jgi:hypothetical protein